MNYYYDSCALVKRYKRESGTNVINSIFSNPNSYHYCIEITIIEILKAFYRIHYHPQHGATPNSQKDFEQCQAHFLSDLKQITELSFNWDIIEICKEILELHWIPGAFDLVQLAGCLKLTRSLPDEEVTFVCADEELLLVAQNYSEIKTLNPNNGNI